MRSKTSNLQKVGFDETFRVISDNGKRIAQGDYEANGSIPIVDQGMELVGGYTSDLDKKYQGPLPVILFGDHTRRVKFIDFEFAVGAQGIKILKPLDGWKPKYLYYMFPTLDYPDRGYSRHFQFLKKLQFPKPSLNEQQLVVSEIEKHFTRLDAGVDALKRVQANLKRYRASVLKAACEGTLVPTEAELAKKEGRDYEPANVLLERILKERRKKWEASELEKMQAKGKLPKDDQWKKKYKEPDAPDTSNLPELPEGWCWVSVDQVTENLDHLREPINKKERSKRVGNIPYFGANGQIGWIDDYLFNERLVLVVEDETFTGRTDPFCYLISGKTWVNNHAHVLRATGALDTKYLNYSLMFYPFTALTTGTTGRRKLTKRALMGASYALPPLAEQIRINSEIERRLSFNNAFESSVISNLVRSDVLRGAILSAAFTGSLIGNHSNQFAVDRPILVEGNRAIHE